jgi:hypothetical protein
MGTCPLLPIIKPSIELTKVNLFVPFYKLKAKFEYKIRTNIGNYLYLKSLLLSYSNYPNLIKNVIQIFIEEIELKSNGTKETKETNGTKETNNKHLIMNPIMYLIILTAILTTNDSYYDFCPEFRHESFLFTEYEFKIFNKNIYFDSFINAIIEYSNIKHIYLTYDTIVYLDFIKTNFKIKLLNYILLIDNTANISYFKNNSPIIKKYIEYIFSIRFIWIKAVIISSLNNKYFGSNN